MKLYSFGINILVSKILILGKNKMKQYSDFEEALKNPEEIEFFSIYTSE